MRKSSVVIVFLSLVLVPVLAYSSSAKEELSKDLVQFQENKMFVEYFQLCGQSSDSKQVRFYSEAPEGDVISRDNFVAYSFVSSALLKRKIFPDKEEAGSTTCRDISSPIGDVDLDVSLFMNADGFKLQIHDFVTGKRINETNLWDEI